MQNAPESPSEASAAPRPSRAPHATSEAATEAASGAHEASEAHAPLSNTDLDEIEARAAALYEYATVTDEEGQAALHELTDTDVPALLAEIRRQRAALDEMTHLRDNALRALYRDDVDTDIDLEETIAAPFYGPGWDWDEHDLQPVVREAANAVRPAFGKLTQERDRLRVELATEKREHEFTMRQRNNRGRRLLHLRDLANTGDTEHLLAAAKDTLAASVDDFTPAELAAAQADVDALNAEFPDEPQDGTRPCGHDDYHDPHEWADRPGVWCGGHSHADDEAVQA